MSAGRSSHVAACFSVERTKYLMLSKSIPSSSPPQVGIGLRWKSLRPFRRRSSIHCGSLFFAEMSRTTSSLRPRLRGGAGGVASRTSRTGSGRGPRARGCARRSVVMRVNLSVPVVGDWCGCRWPGCRSCRPRRRGRWWPAAGRGGRGAVEMTSVSASHSCGNSCGDVGDRAVVLAQLLADRARCGPRRRSHSG